MIPFRFVHAADLHLDSPFKGLTDVPDAVRQTLEEATFGALRRLTETAIAAEADFVVLAGDLYDEADRSLRAQAVLHQAWSRLSAAGIGVFAIHGNHDPLTGERARFALPDGVHVFGAGRIAEGKPAYRKDGKLAAFVYGISYGSRAVHDNLAPGYRPSPEADFHIALLHGNVDGHPGHDPYAPSALPDLTSGGMHYWALGHIHGRRVLHTYPHVVYSGNTQGRHSGETGPKGCYVVDVRESGEMKLTFAPLDEVRWLTADVPIDGIPDEEQLLAALETACEDAVQAAEGRAVMLSLRLSGRGPLHGKLTDAREHRDLLSALRERVQTVYPADAPGWVWVHRLDAATGPALDLERLAEEDSFAGEAFRLYRRLRLDTEDLEAFTDEALAGMMASARLRRLLKERGALRPDELLERAALRLAGMLAEEESR